MATDSSPRNSGGQPLTAAVPTANFHTVYDQTATHRTLKYDFNDYFGESSQAQPAARPPTTSSKLWDAFKQSMILFGCLMYMAHTMARDYASSNCSGNIDSKKKE